MEDSKLENNVESERAASLLTDKRSSPKVEAALEGTNVVAAAAGESGRSTSENVSVPTDKDPIIIATSKSLDGQTQAAVDEEVVSMDNVESERAASILTDKSSNPKVEAALEGTNVAAAAAGEGGRSTSENVYVSTDIDPITIATSKSLDGQTQFAVDEKVVTMDNVESERAASILTDKSSSPKVEAALEGTNVVAAAAGEGGRSASENVSVSTDKDPIIVISTSLDGQTQVAVDEKVVSMDNVESERADSILTDKSSSPKVEAALEGTTVAAAAAGEGGRSTSENVYVSTDIDPITIATSKSLDGQTQVAVDEKVVTMDNVESERAASILTDKSSIPKVEAALEGTNVAAAGEGGRSTSENVSVSTDKDPITIAIPKSLDEQSQVAVDEKVFSMDNVESERAASVLTDKSSSPKVEAALEGTNVAAAAGEGGRSTSENVSVSTDKDPFTIATSKSLDGQTQVAVDEIVVTMDIVESERAASILTEKSSSPKVEAALEGTNVAAAAAEGGRSTSKNVSVSSDKAPITIATSKSLDGQTQVAVDEKVVSMDSEDITCPGVEGMETDAFNENFCFSVEELQATFETANGSTENHYDAFADVQSSQQPTQVVVEGEVAATDNMVFLNSKEDRKSLTGECSDKCVPHDSSRGNSDVEPEFEVDKVAGIHEERGNADASSESTENHSSAGLNSATLSQSAHVKFTEMDDKVHSVPHFEGTVGEADHMETDGEMTLMDKDEVVTAGAASEPSEKDPSLEPKEGLDKNVTDTAQVDSNIGQLMDAQDQVCHVDQLAEGHKKEEQISRAEAVFLGTEIESPVMNGSQTANNVVVLNSKTGLEDSADGDQHVKAEQGLNDRANHEFFEPESSTGIETAVDESEQNCLLVGQEMKAEEQDMDSEQASLAENAVKAHQVSYQLPSDDEGEFTVSDLVWGKVRSHPWWPGQIFDPSDASEKAMKYHKKDCFFVAYFGDRTFAWVEASLLKPFRSNFSQVEKLSNLESFQNAVDCALEEVSRRVEFGLACSCLPEDTYDKIKFQIIENAGIREESSKRICVDKSFLADFFEPCKLLDYTKALAQYPAGGADRLEVAVARSQLLAFHRLRGYSQLSEFQGCGGMLEDAENLHFADEVGHASPVCGDEGQNSSAQEVLQAQRSYNKRKHNLKDTIYPRKKERSMSVLMDGSWDSVDDELGPDEKAGNKLVSPSGKKPKGSDLAEDSAMTEGRKTISFAKVSTTAPPLPKPSFKIGECIRRVASQMTGSPSILKANSQKQDGSSDGLVGDATDVSFLNNEDVEMRKMSVPMEYSSLDGLLSQLTKAARDPLTGCSSLTIIVTFFSDFRNSVILEQHDKLGGKRKHSVSASPETFEFEDMGDTYWTDRVIQNGSEEQPSRKSRKRDNVFVPVELDKPANKSNSRKRYSDVNYGQASEKPAGYIDEKAPAELVMHFPVVDSVPSEISLNKMFRCFGPIKESETEVDKDTNRARVVFKRCSDAEAAYGSAPKFNIFGSILVNYQLNYTISVPFKSEPVSTLQEEDAALFLQY